MKNQEKEKNSSGHKDKERNGKGKYRIYTSDTGKKRKKENTIQIIDKDNITLQEMINKREKG